MRWVVLLACLAAAPRAAAQPVAGSLRSDDRGGFLLDVRVAAGLPLAYPSSKPEALSALAFGLGWRFGPRWSAALVLDGASGDLAELGYALGLSESWETPGCGGAASCGFHLVLGVEVARTFEQHPRRPWVALLLGLEGLDVGDDARLESWFGPVLRASAGAPLWRGWALDIGLFASAELGWWTDHEVEAGGVTSVLAVGPPVHGALSAGLRIAWLP